MEQLLNGLLWAANWIGSVLCHQWDSHSYIINGVPLCLCARCTGMFLGALLALVYLAVTTRGFVRMPRRPYLAVFLIFFVLWAGDGVNSYLTTLSGAPFLYPPQNLLRLTTGTLMGIGLGSLAFVILNLLLRPIPKGITIPPLYERASNFLILLGLGAILVMTIQSQRDWLLYPLTALMLFAMLAVMTTFWAGILSSLSMQPSQPVTVRRTVLIAFGMTLLVLNAMALVRAFSGLVIEPPI